MTTWNIDPTHSDLTFAVKHMGFSTVRGRFGGVSGTISLAPEGTVAAADVTVDVTTVDTGMEQRDGHLKSPDFFDVANHGTAKFTLTAVTQQADGTMVAQGDLTIRGVTRPVTLTGHAGEPATDPFGNRRIGASLTTKIARKDWGLTWNVALEKGGWLVSEDVTLNVDVQAIAA
ncbi:MAG: YceI family protein [Gemmatimonadaceae bacterium]|jgi:polyisoprenoid-binding protein YceI|nr:YceI family protein [Gemmatimonadaceae bacterium]